ncbi:flagellar export chaperone FliS [Acidovorax sp. NCPPB 2350]|nr:flagellar export chaperone FliS [Paracidovorax anthurii]WCM95262.1 flagellar export chaperone FliS [Acidovorax sp. NCPPB 2350]
MVSQDAYGSYHAVNLNAQASQASPVQLVLMLTDGLLEELVRAKSHIEARRYELKARSLDRCVDILNGLSGALDTDSGEEVVGNLGRLYDYCADRLCHAGLQLDGGIVQEVIGLITTLRQGWQGMQARVG